MKKNRKGAVLPGAVSSITSSARNPLNKLPLKRRVYVASRASGASVKESAANAGVSKCMGSKYEKNADIQAAYSFLLRKAIPAGKLVKLIAGGCEAKSPVYGPDGKKKGERADWKTRRPYVEMAAEHGEYFVKKAESNQTMIAVTVQHVGGKERPQVINAEIRSLPEAPAETV